MLVLKVLVGFPTTALLVSLVGSSDESCEIEDKREMQYG